MFTTVSYFPFWIRSEDLLLYKGAKQRNAEFEADAILIDRKFEADHAEIDDHIKELTAAMADTDSALDDLKSLFDQADEIGKRYI